MMGQVTTMVSPPLAKFKIDRDTKLSGAAQEKLRKIQTDRHNAFVGSDRKLGTCILYLLKLGLKPGASPFRQRQYQMSPLVREEESKQIKDFVAQGV